VKSKKYVEKGIFILEPAGNLRMKNEQRKKTNGIFAMELIFKTT
jgi:hypothetical protein